MTNEQKAVVLDAIRRAVKALVEKWDAMRDAEIALGKNIELDTTDLVEMLAYSTDSPDDAMSIAEIDIIPAIEEMLSKATN